MALAKAAPDTSSLLNCLCHGSNDPGQRLADNPLIQSFDTSPSLKQLKHPKHPRLEKPLRVLLLAHPLQIRLTLRSITPNRVQEHPRINQMLVSVIQPCCLRRRLNIVDQFLCNAIHERVIASVIPGYG